MDECTEGMLLRRNITIKDIIRNISSIIFPT